MSNHSRQVLLLLALLALPFTPSPAWAQRGQPQNQGESSTQTLSEEDRWAAEDDPSQLEPEKQKSSEPPKIPAAAVLGVRSAYGLPGGSIAQGSDLADAMAGQVAFQLDFGILLESGLYFGAFGQYGLGLLGSAIADSCDEAERVYPSVEVSCSAYDIRGGVVLEYHHGAGKKRKPVDPWLGVGFGMEFASFRVAAQDSASAAVLTQSVTGFEYLSAHFGVDFALADWFAVGPYLSFAAGSYGSTDVSCEGDCDGVGTGSGDIVNTTLHTWTFFGVHALVQFGDPSTEAEGEH
jgi:hypothetical protein